MPARPTTPERTRVARARGRLVGAGLLDQVVIAAANSANTLLGGILLPKARFGALALALAVGYFATCLNRAIVGDVLLALASRHDGEPRARLARNGLATALCSGLITTVVFVVLWALCPGRGEIDLRQLIWLAPFMVPIVLHDTARFDYLSDRRPDKALGIDLVWAGTQAVAVVIMILTHTSSAGGLLTAWGLGATAGITVYLVRERRLPWQGSPPAWLADTRHLSGWFTVTAIVAQVQVLAISFIVAGRLSKIELANLRFVQTVQLQPVQNLVTAVQSLLVPSVSRNAADAAEPGPEGARAALALRRQTRRLAIAFAVVGALMVLTVWPVVSYALVHTHKFAEAAPLVLPIALQCALYLLQVPFTAAMRGMHRARMLFVQYVIFVVVSLSGLTLGAELGGLRGAAWGLLTGSTASLICMVTLYAYAVRGVRAVSAGPRRRSSRRLNRGGPHLADLDRPEDVGQVFDGPGQVPAVRAQR
ncbi:MATE family efflux transporter [Dactylosporangium darangshiense]|uniref:Polysaccharide biosynthesis protein n=1 Tax=Dactylosporangium darangshiense TaxID=579108 RepID=A0ABP8CX14_9ACTN